MRGRVRDDAELIYGTALRVSKPPEVERKPRGGGE